MQARLRSGRSIKEVALEAAVEESWVERFAGPVVAEQWAAIDRAGRLTLTTARRGDSPRPLAESLKHNLELRGGRMGDAERLRSWSAYHDRGNEWVVTFRYRWRNRDQEAEWRADLRSGQLTAANRL